jgi:hypothetical protein
VALALTAINIATTTPKKENAIFFFITSPYISDYWKYFLPFYQVTRKIMLHPLSSIFILLVHNLSAHD